MFFVCFFFVFILTNISIKCHIKPWLKLALDGDGQQLYPLADSQPVQLLLRPRRGKKKISLDQEVKTKRVKTLVALANGDRLEGLHKCWQKQIARKLTLGPGGCWLAQYAPNKKENGYSQVSFKSTKYMAHTISLLLWKHGIDGHLPVSHLCHQSKCVNPQHLIQVLPPSLLHLLVEYQCTEIVNDA
jgi:hypothetical protein